MYIGERMPRYKLWANELGYYLKHYGSPIKRRESIEFGKLFDKILKELQNEEKR